jgi:hypothetical protein
MSFKRKIKKLEKSLDINTYLPGYISKPIFRVGFGFMLLFIIGLLFAYGLSAQWVSAECEDLKGCMNPYIDCQENYFTEPLRCKFYNSLDCEGRNCDTDWIKYGDYIGQKPPTIIQYANIYLLIILSSTFLINHLNWVLNRLKVQE